MVLENIRSTSGARLYLASETNLLDIQLFSRLIDGSDDRCEFLIEENINFGNKVYRDAIKIDEYEDARKLTPELIDQHRKYDLLRTLFWINSIKIKEKCGSTSTIVYLYDYGTDQIEIEAKQKAYSTYLSDLKEDFGKDIVLIPIAKNMDLSSLDVLRARYQFNETGIIVDEKIFIRKVEDLHKIREYLSELYHNKP